MGKTLTPENVLSDLRDATYVTSMRIQPTNPKFTLMLKDAAFALEAHTVVTDKITQLKKGDGQFQPHTSARNKTIAGWQSALAKIEDSLHISSGQTLR